MTDYLEELLGGEALLEAARRLEGALDGLARPRREESETARREAGLSRERQEDVQNPLAEEGSPLLEAVEALERRSAQGVAAQEGRNRGQSLSALRDGKNRREAWTAGGGRGAGPETALTVRQVDRAFQTDSRRYDGGFFLY